MLLNDRSSLKEYIFKSKLQCCLFVSWPKPSCAFLKESQIHSVNKSTAVPHKFTKVKLSQ